ncbi:MAG: NAD+ synthase [Candidatus Heimdallarchaeota archaeon]|nr:NAD+ synthase [Candidatus Heimdallarchaeota archaeon]
MIENAFKISICQFNATVGDLKGNTERIITYIKEAQLDNTDLLIFPELTLTGYIPQDLLYHEVFSKSISSYISKIVLQIKTDMYVIIGAPIAANEPLSRFDQRYYNSALVLSKTGIVKQVNKVLMPNYDIFMEKRYFVPEIITDAPEQGIFNFKGLKIGLELCEDMWSHLPIYELGEYTTMETQVTRALAKKGADLVINISASPFVKDKSLNRLKIIKNHAEINQVPFIYVNEVGGVDEIVFDGRSMVCSAEGDLVFAAPPFEEGLFSFSTDQLQVRGVEDEFISICKLSKEEEFFRAITLNLRDYLKKINFNKKVLIALSGGIDSALTASLCVAALGADRVIGVSLPSKFSSVHSKDDAKLLADNLGIEYHSISIQDIHQQFQGTLSQHIDYQENLADENIQSRIRGVIMMYLSNLWGHILVSTGNKSEIAMGYCTLYGDTAGGKNLIGDLYKMEVYALAKYINQYYPKIAIPVNTINKEPSAELREDQKDSDSLPEYPVLDRILEMMVDLNLSTEQIIKYGENKETVEKIAHLLQISEFKRAQLVQTVKLTANAFGIGRRVPTATPFKY